MKKKPSKSVKSRKTLATKVKRTENNDLLVTFYGSYREYGWGDITMVRKTGEIVGFKPQ